MENMISASNQRHFNYAFKTKLQKNKRKAESSAIKEIKLTSQIRVLEKT